ncbi:MAG: aminomethyltransferase family protein [Planctomycetaceae bacterium]|nr:aminomethyltransferase family protein [Planctomycetaceae bacterium]
MPADRVTPLHDRHLGLGATMASFAGYDMPLWYQSGAVREHLAVIETAGLFDTSHMDVVIVSGDAAPTFLDYAFTRNLRSVRPGRAGYGAFLREDGTCIDDGIVYPLDGSRYGIVLNAAMAEPVAAHLRTLPGADAVDVTGPAIPLGKIDIQGPLAFALVRELFSDESLFGAFPYFSFRGDFDLNRSDIRLDDGTPAVLSRTGYTGELGFELFVPADRTGAVWDRLIETGRDRGVLPAGLAARDSLRTGAVLPLSHQDIGPWPFRNHPWSFALPLAADGSFTKDFHGRDGLAEATDAAFTLPFAGFDQRRVEAADSVVLHDGREVGRATTVASDMAIGRVEGRIASIASPGRPDGFRPRGLACGFVRCDREFLPGERLVLKDARREIPVEIVRDIRPDRTARKALRAAE